jgi:hypothetical protein
MFIALQVCLTFICKTCNICQVRPINQESGVSNDSLFPNVFYVFQCVIQFALFCEPARFNLC